MQHQETLSRGTGHSVPIKKSTLFCVSKSALYYDSGIRLQFFRALVSLHSMVQDNLSQIFCHKPLFHVANDTTGLMTRVLCPMSGQLCQVA